MKIKIHNKSDKCCNLLILLILLIAYGSGAKAQSTEWMSFQKSSKLTQVRGLGVDNYENVYSVATFDNELRVGSSEPYQDTFGTFWPWKQHVFTKHSSLGQLLFTALIETRGGNSNMAEVRKMHVTAEGKIIVHLICNGQFYYVDPNRNETKLRSAYKQTSVLVIGSDGRLLNHIGVPIRDCRQIIDDGLGGVYLLARDFRRNRGFNNQLYKIDYSEKAAVEIAFTHGLIQKIHCFRGMLWIATVENDKKRGYYYSSKIGLYSSDLTNLQDFIAADKINVGLNYFCEVEFVLRANDLHLVMLSKSLDEFTLNEKKLKIEKGEIGLLVLNTSLGLEDYTTFKGLSHNLKLMGLQDGSLILQFSVLDSLVVGGRTKQVFPRHSDFIYELVHVKLSPTLAFEWAINGGGTATNYHVSEMDLNRSETTLYVGSDLLNYGNFDTGYVENDWRSSYYIRKIRL